jgi:hypothetical protein
MRKIALILLTLILVTFLLPATTVAAATIDLQALPNDGHLYTSGTDWNIINDQDTALIDTVNTKIYVDSTWDSSEFLNSRGVLFLTSGIDYTRIAAATLYFYVDTITADQADTTLLFLAPTGGHPVNPLAQNDYNRDWYTTVIGYIATEELTPGQYHSATLDVGQWLMRNDTVGVVMMTSLDYNAVAPTGTNTVVVASAESAHPPRITIQYRDDANTVLNQEITDSLSELKTITNQIAATQISMQEQLSMLKNDVAGLTAPNTEALTNTVNSLSEQLKTLQQSSDQQGGDIASILNQLGTLPGIKTDVGRVLAGQETMIGGLSNNFTLMQEQLQEIRSGNKSGTTIALLVLICSVLVLILVLLVTMKRRMI